LAELGRDVIHPDRVEHLLLGPSSDPDPADLAWVGRRGGSAVGGPARAAVRRLLRRPALAFPFAFAEHPVLVDLEAAVDPHAAHADVVGLGAGEVVERGAPRLWPDDAE